MKMLNLIEYVHTKNEPFVVLSLDFEKAFDKLEWEAMHCAMKAFGIGEQYRNMFQILHANPVSCTTNNGYWSEWFFPTRACRQGDPISSLIFVLKIEILGIKLHRNINIKGVQMSKRELKNNQYANNLWLTLQPDIAVIQETLRELRKFTKFSGLTINYDKSVTKIIGPVEKADAKLYSLKPLHWSDGPIQLLGVTINNDISRIF